MCFFNVLCQGLRTPADNRDLGSETDRAYTSERLGPGHLQHAEIVACLLTLFIKAAQTSFALVPDDRARVSTM